MEDDKSAGDKSIFSNVKKPGSTHKAVRRSHTRCADDRSSHFPLSLRHVVSEEEESRNPWLAMHGLQCRFVEVQPRHLLTTGMSRRVRRDTTRVS